ncbi:MULTISPECIES: ABC transporter ATP-binding protein [Pseudomonas]|uniref:ABC transporter ATP-binding protein n=2 Tax=Pseudomonas nitroreducens/multiresinivorans group TaxID=627141 RepID=A0A6G6J5J7_PSENT|nr:MULTISPECIES: ABC transporter ATP-binding protein [Pseudomonas]MCE4067792.1 ABC transporter ATP-binding protein [Pseudomonas nitritireducens]MCE4076981.1 ABC transporter ATP-binding protein [Pseudomonas nitroreducens]MCJ1879205.1 ABC transporter ATP-binding protein [Pseudomonas nitroreducens]MCJ1895981.1 ABC transporter ATP-binding protein [Pseudomonas nitroreducens]MDH1071335.1 ABC transporter ATP-binding protein [Pseudomonas nitroreducens]
MGAVAIKQEEAAVTGQEQARPPRLRVENVSLRYRTPEGGTFSALESVSFEVPDQQFAVIVGPSGCGKSSLLYLTAGLAEPTEGDIYVGGQLVDGPGADRGMVFQSYTLFPWLTVRQNVEFGLKRRGMPAAERREIVDYYLDEVGLRRFENNYPKQLSGGMMQRVAIARALANDPQILLMDEPFGALDSQTRMQMQQLLLRVWDHSKKTVVFVTHDIDEAILLGDRVYVMGARPGRIKRILDVPIERPRSLDMVMDRQFIEMKREILGLLHDDLEEAH